MTTLLDEILARSASGTCIRCKRKLTDPVSVKRGMGPYCWTVSMGDVFASDLEASDEEWARRELVLRRGGEIDLGVNWQYVEIDEHGCAVTLPLTMRISIRYRDGMFEAYGAPPAELRPEFVIHRSSDLREVYRAAVEAGPRFNALTHAAMAKARRRARRAA